MRVEPYAEGSFVHVIKRGARGLPITNDVDDQRRFVRLLYLMNDSRVNPNWARLDEDSSLRANHTREPLVKLVAFTLMLNHFHLIVQQIRAGGLASFMQKLGQSMSNHFNEKYRQKGSLFQGAYRGRTIGDDDYFRYVSAYVLVKNVFELFPNGGLAGARAHFDEAWAWASSYPYSSLGLFVRGEVSHIVDTSDLSASFPTTQAFKNFSRDVVESGKWLDSEYE